MNTVTFAFVVAALLSAAAAFVWAAVQLRRQPPPIAPKASNREDELIDILTEDFREELRNRARLHFERIIRENAHFMQQELREASVQLAETMKEEVREIVRQEVRSSIAAARGKGKNDA